MSAARHARRRGRSARGVQLAIAMGMLPRGPCLVCGCGLDGLHRTVDAVRQRRGAGEDAETIALGLGLREWQVRALCGEDGGHSWAMVHQLGRDPFNRPLPARPPLGEPTPSPAVSEDS